MEQRDREIVAEMWTMARNAPLTMASLSPFGVMDREQYRRRVGNVLLELTLDCDQRSNIWSYELAILDAEGGVLEAETIQYWLTAFFGRQSSLASRRNFLLTGEARFTYPYSYGL